jgi:trehalose 6-phosphate phosphatase
VSDGYFLDIDGTLAEITPEPSHARVDDDLRRELAAARLATGGAVALVSGRSIADVDALFPGERYPVAGQHGSEWRTAVGELHREGFSPERMAWLRAEVARVVAARPGIVIEDKGGSIAFHYRRAPRLGPFVHRAVRRIAAATDGDVQVQVGKRVVELVPAGHDKGKAVETFLEAPPFVGRRPVFVGDDVTDEAAFATVNRIGGISVKVGNGPTIARYRLRSVPAVRAWLSKLAG